MNIDRWTNVLQLDHDYGSSRSRLTGRPLEAYVEVAARCNLRCRMCPIIVDPRYQPGSGTPGLLSDEVFEQLVPIFPSLQRAYLFGLGEPLLHPRLVDYVRRAADAGVEVWVTTNATLLDQDKADALARAGLARVSVSIDGGTAATYERIRQRGRWDDVVRGLAALGEAKRRFGRPAIYLNVVAMQSNLQELPQLLELCARHGGDGVFVESLYAYEHPVIEEFVAGEHLGHLGRERVDAIFADAHRRAEELGIELLTRVEEQELSGRLIATPLTQTAAATTGSNAGGASEGLVTIGTTRATAGALAFGTGAATATAASPATAVAYPPLTAASAADPARAPNPLPSEIRMPWLCSEPWATINVNSAGEVRPCCFNDTVLGTLGPQTFDEIWNGAGYGGLRDDMAAGRVPGTCAACVRQKRVKRNTYLQPPRLLRRALPGPPPLLDIELVAPAAGELLANLVIFGRAHHRNTLDAWRDLMPAQLPDLYLDDNRVAALQGYAAIAGNWFAAALPLDFISAGAHELSLRDGEGRELPSPGRRRLQVAARRDGGVTAVRILALPLTLQRPEWRAGMWIDGRRHRLRHWFCGRHGDGHLCVAVADVSDLQPGRHELELRFDDNPPYTCALEQLPPPR
jgi:MoaA/NifB/PqqE/SkfB family radical SAM enzyme